MKRAAAFLLLLCVLLSRPVLAMDSPPPLDKPTAQRIMENMEWTEVTIITVRQGVDAKGNVAPIFATVLGVGLLHGEHHSICQTLFYDSDLDWHYLEMQDKGARVWNKNGYREIKPWSTW